MFKMVHLKLKLLFVLLFLLFVNPAYSKDQLIVYSTPESNILNTDFTTQVRLSDQEWKTLPNYLIKVDEVKNTRHNSKDASMCYFDFSGEVEISITYSGSIQTSRIRPLSYGIKPEIKDNIITFKLSQPRNLSIEVNGDIFHNLHLFANPIYESIPDKNDTNVIYFGPGIHQLKDKVLKVSSGKTVYLSGGAILMAQVLFENVENAKLLGHGMIEQSIRHGVCISNSKNIKVDGVFCSQCFTGGSDNVVIRNVKSISYFKWGDGMNVMSSNNVLIDGVFNRNSDDCTTVYGTRGDYIGGCRNVTM